MRRIFARTDRVTAFARAYQKAGRPAPTVTVSIADASGKSLFSTTAKLTSGPFGKLQASDCSFELPLARLVPGLYLLTLDMTSGKNTTGRSTSFTVQ